MTQNRTRPRRRSLDLSELREASLIADLVFSGIDDPDPTAFELAIAPVLTHWSVAVGPRLIGVDERGAVLVLDVQSISRCRSWARTPDGLIRLRAQSRIPLARESRR